MSPPHRSVPARLVGAGLFAAVLCAPALPAVAAQPPDSQALPSSSGPAADKPILPGYWSYKASTVLGESSNGRQCVRPDKIDEFLSGPHNRHYHCVYPARRVADGEAAFQGVCTGKRDGPYKVEVSGSYTKTSFELKGHISGALLGVPLKLPIGIEARWIGPDCPPDAK